MDFCRFGTVFGLNGAEFELEADSEVEADFLACLDGLEQSAAGAERGGKGEGGVVDVLMEGGSFAKVA